MNSMRKWFAMVSALCILVWKGYTQPVDTPLYQAPETVAADGAWCWFSDPRARYYKGNREQVYYGYISHRGDVMISSKNIKTDEIDDFVLHEELQIDDHNVPSILILPDKRLLVFYTEHNGRVFMRKSRYAENIREWEPEIVLMDDPVFKFTYTNPVLLAGENNRIYLFGRTVKRGGDFRDWYQYFIYSDDLGKTWSPRFVYLDNGGRNNPTYLKVTSDNQSRIDFLFTDGHPKIGSDVSVFHMYYQQGAFFQTDGAELASIENIPVKISEVDKVYDAGKDSVRAWIWDIVLDDKKHPVITYTRYPDETDHRYYYAYWDGSKWIDRQLANGGGWMPNLNQGDRVQEAHYSGGLVVDPVDVRSVYLSRKIDGFFEIERWKLSDDGNTWTADPITKHSDTHHMRPFAIRTPNQSILMWMSGDYNHYTKYKTSINGRFKQ